MEASIKEVNIRHFVRLLQCAARFGDDLCMHADKNVWELAVTNSSKSAHCQFTLNRDFFSRYAATGSAAQQKRGVKCKLLVKSVLNVLGKASSLNAVDRLDLRIVDPAEELRKATQRRGEEEHIDDDDVRTSRGARLQIKLLYKHGIIKKHFLHLASSDFFRAEVDPDSTPSGFIVEARVLRDWLDHFSIAFTSASGSSFPGAGGSIRNENQLGWMFAREEVRVKSWEGINSHLSTEIKLDRYEFEDYVVENERGRVDLTLPIKEFKAMLQLAEQLNMSLDFKFSEASQPITISSSYLDDNMRDTEVFRIFCAIATTHCDAFRSPEERSTAPANTSGSTVVKTGSNVSAQRRRASEASQRSGSARSRLSMVPETRSRSGSSNVAIVHGSVREETAASGSQVPVNGGDNREGRQPLFDPAPDSPPPSQLMSQADILEMSGLAGEDPEDLLAAMDGLDGADPDIDMRNPDVPEGFGDISLSQNLIPPAPARQPRRPTPQSLHESTRLDDTSIDFGSRSHFELQPGVFNDLGDQFEARLFPGPGRVSDTAQDLAHAEEEFGDDEAFEGEELGATQAPRDKFAPLFGD
ncbi:hypothetical protein Q5752_000650 [Cryptotrichosporon argae]